MIQIRFQGKQSGMLENQNYFIDYQTAFGLSGRFTGAA